MEPKLVYLFELDSVRKTDQEILEGQKTLYNELVHHGNCVVLTYNQLVDSRAFFSLFSDPEGTYYNSFVELFEHKRILLSQYGDVRTLSQYLVNSVSQQEPFIYSALPIKYSQRRLLALMRRSLVYSDLSEISGYLDGSLFSKDELKDLFIEIQPDGTEVASSLSEGDMKAALTHLRSLLSIILKLSTVDGSYIPPRDPNEISSLRFYDILARVLRMKSTYPLWASAIAAISSLPAYKDHEAHNRRSPYLQQLYLAAKTGAQEKQACQYAEAIINLCFNYACEISICGTSKRYDPQELLDPDNPAPSFETDFQQRLDHYWNNGADADSRFIQKETNEFIPYRKPHGFPDFSKAVRLLQYEKSGKISITTKLTQPVPRYEYCDLQQQKYQKHQIMRTILLRVLFSVLCFSIAVILEITFNVLQDTFDFHIPVHSLPVSILETIAFLWLSEELTTLIARHCEGFLSLSDAIKEIGDLFRDAFHTLFWMIPRKNTNDKYDKTEQRNVSAPIRFITPEPIKRYRKLEALRHAPLIVSSAYEEEADLAQQDIIGALVRQEETSNRRYGLIYQSAYNTLIVDPMIGSADDIYPYERVLPTNGDGVVMAVMCHERFILLNQFRHALQQPQLCFPRGFAEEHENGKEAAIRELMEELNAAPAAAPRYLGEIAPDSGLTSRRTKAYLITINSYQVTPGEEGVISAIEVTKEHLQEMIRTGKINDAYTIGAFSFYLFMKGG